MDVLAVGCRRRLCLRGVPGMAMVAELVVALAGASWTGIAAGFGGDGGAERGSSDRAQA